MDIHYKQVLPEGHFPICIIGAGGIVRDAHLPAYKKAGFEVWSLTDLKIGKAENLAAEYEISHVFDSAADAVAAAPQNAVYDLALMPAQSLNVLSLLPDGATVLIQKPMGDTFRMAKEIHSLCKQKNLTAAVNFQLRYAPFVKAAREIIRAGWIGEIYDMEIRLTTYTPWEIFPSVVNQKRLEILYHSIHYIDLIRSFLGTPRSILAKTHKHPAKEASSTRTTVLFDYEGSLHAVINANHDHEFGTRHQESFIKWEGTKGAIKAKMGLLLNYPEGVPDMFEYCLLQEGKEPKWETMDLDGSWFPDAFIGTMSRLIRYREGAEKTLPTRIDDALETMAVVESAYISNRKGGVQVEELLPCNDEQ